MVRGAPDKQLAGTKNNFVYLCSYPCVRNRGARRDEEHAYAYGEVLHVELQNIRQHGSHDGSQGFDYELQVEGIASHFGDATVLSVGGIHKVGKPLRPVTAQKLTSVQATWQA